MGRGERAQLLLGTRGQHVRREEGQTLILVVLALPLLLAMIALVIDGANLFTQRRSVQNAADAAALAAGAKLNRDLSACTGLDTDSTTCAYSVRTAAEDYSSRNSGPSPLHFCFDSADTNCYVTPYNNDNARVQVRLKKSVSGFFTGAVGLSNLLSVSASSVAGLSPVVAAGSVVPMAVSESHAPCWPPRPGDPTCVPFDTTVTFDFDADPKGFSLIDLSRRSSSGPTTCGTPGDPPCKSASVLRDWIEFGYPDTLPPAWYAGDNGNKNGLKSGLSAAQKAGTILFIPVFDQIDPPSSANPTSFKVIGFAAFRICRKQGGTQPSPPALDCLGVADGLAQWNNSGTGHQLVGQFTTFIDSGVGCGNTCSGNSFGVFAVTLFE